MKCILKSLLITMLGVSGCTKEDISPDQAATVLEETPWRMTAYSVERKSMNGTGGSISDFFKSYSNNAPISCLGLNTLTFASGGNLFWTQEAGGCAVMVSTTPQSRANIEWGQWHLNSSKNQLTINTTYAAPGSSVLPVMYAATGAYEVVRLDRSTLILSSKHVFGLQKDSLLIEQVVFAPL